MNQEQQERLLTAFLSGYTYAFLVDMEGDLVMTRYETDSLPGADRAAVRVREIPMAHYSYEDALEEMGKKYLKPAYKSWFETEMSRSKIRSVFEKQDAFSLVCPLKDGRWGKCEFRRIPERDRSICLVLLCFADRMFQVDQAGEKRGAVPDRSMEMAEYIYSLQVDLPGKHLYQGAVSVDAVATYEIDVTKNLVVSAWIGEPDIIYNPENLPYPGPLSLHARSWAKRIRKGDREAFLNLIDPENLKRCCENGTRELWIEYMITDRLGRDVFLRESVLLAPNAETGSVQGLVVLRDVTCQKEMEEENRRRMQVIEALTREYKIVFFVNLDTDILTRYRVDERIESVYGDCFGSSFTEALTRFTPRGIYTYDRASFKAALDPANIRQELEERPEFSFTFRGNAENGPSSYRAKIARLGGEKERVREILLGFADIQEERNNEMKQRLLLESALERARQAGEAKTAFLSNMSHDIRTPMNAILGFAELARLTPSDTEQVIYSLDRILQSGEHLLQLINNVLDMSRIESGRMQLNEVRCSLRDIVSDTVGLLTQQMHEKDLHFRQIVDDQMQDTVFCDRLRITQLILNLLTNAVKYTDREGHIELELKKEGEAPKGYMPVKIRVRDDGIGMSEEFQKKIYDPFERENTEVVSHLSGSGLGLPICRGIVDLMGGSISVWSVPGEGTEFVVNIAIRLDEDSHQLQTVSSGDQPTMMRYRIFRRSGEFDLSPQPKHLGKKRILLVEDNYMNQEVARRLLEHSGYLVELADNGRRCVERVEETPEGFFDAILMDVRMPLMDGYEASRQVRSLKGRGELIPIIAMTADAFAEDVKKARQAGMDAFISKPVDERTLNLVLSRCIG